MKLVPPSPQYTSAFIPKETSQVLFQAAVVPKVEHRGFGSGLELKLVALPRAAVVYILLQLLHFERICLPQGKTSPMLCQQAAL